MGEASPEGQGARRSNGLKLRWRMGGGGRAGLLGKGLPEKEHELRFEG